MMKSPFINLFPVVLLMLGALALGSQQANAQETIESWENSLDGWTVEASGYTAAFSTTTGVTAGLYSLSLTGTAGPNYGQMLESASSTTYTIDLAGASALRFNVYAPAGSFGGYLQLDVDINNADAGFVSLDGYSYASATIGGESTISVPISSALRNTLAASANPTTLVIQVGGGNTTGNETFYLDNLQVTQVPEPSVAALAALGSLGVLVARKRFARTA